MIVGSGSMKPAQNSLGSRQESNGCIMTRGAGLLFELIKSNNVVRALSGMLFEWGWSSALMAFWVFKSSIHDGLTSPPPCPAFPQTRRFRSSQGISRAIKT